MNQNFSKLWCAQAVTQLGSEFTLLALPLLAVIQLNATSFQMGLLIALEQLPQVLIGLFAGGLVDRHGSKWFLIAADLVRAALLIILTLTAYLHELDFSLLVVLTIGISVSRVFFDASYSVFLPQILEREHFINGNAKLGLARSFAELCGPPLAGLSIKCFPVANALLVDALSFCFSATILALIRSGRQLRTDQTQRSSFWHESWVGVRSIRNHPIRLALALSGSVWNFFYALIMAIFILYANKELNLSAAFLGLIFVPGGLGFMIGAALTPNLSKLIGLGPTAICGISITSGWGVLLALATGNSHLLPVILMAAMYLFGFGQAMFNITSGTITQIVTPSHLLGASEC